MGEDIVYTLEKYRETEGANRDKSKGIISKPMPRTWHDRHAVNKIEDESTKEFYRSIVADKKPYFMRYIYPVLMKEYKTYIRNTNRNADCEFHMTVDEMKNKSYGELTERQREFLYYYEHRMPVGVGDCVMNKICHRFEEEFDGYIGRYDSVSDFDFAIMKSGEDYGRDRYYTIKKLYGEYISQVRKYKVFSSYERIDKYDSNLELLEMNEAFKIECSEVCPNESMLCDIVLDICYQRSATKSFAWNMCGSDIISNLLKKNQYMISFPVLDADGSFEYAGLRYSVMMKQIEVNE